jgi:hypothetical protein
MDSITVLAELVQQAVCTEELPNGVLLFRVRREAFEQLRDVLEFPTLKYAG